MEKRRNTFFLTLILVGTLITAGLGVWSSFRVKTSSTPTESLAANSNTLVVSETETKEEVLAPNGKMTLILRNVKKADGTTAQTFSVISEDEVTPLQIYTLNSGTDNSISIPFNTFSPDNKFIFLKKGQSEKSEYMVRRTDGKNIKGEDKTVEFTSLFYEKYPEFVITDVTGWGGTGLIVVNSNYLDGKMGPSFWFDLSGFSFIRLSTKFN